METNVNDGQEQNAIQETVLTADEPYAVVIKPAFFIMLSIATLGIYELWWMYKCWRYFKHKEQLDIMPAARALFVIFFGFELFNKIKAYANSREERFSYSPGWIWGSFILFNFLARLPDPYWLVSIISVVFLIAPVRAFNFYFTGSESGTEQSELSGRQLIAIIAGVILWMLVIAGLFGEQ